MLIMAVTIILVMGVAMIIITLIMIRVQHFKVASMMIIKMK